MAIKRTTISALAATGGAGIATATGTSEEVINGFILAVHIAGQDSPPPTLDVTLSEATNDPAMTVLTLTNVTADGWYYPQKQATDDTGAALAGVGSLIPVHDYLTLSVAQADNDDGVVATLYYLQ